jgi:ribosomal-protein-alanine N-acetyltransferase
LSRPPLALPHRLTTARLFLRRPTEADAQSIFERYASVPDVTRYLSWPTHRILEDTRAFLGFSERAWNETGSGPYLVFNREGALVGGTGLTQKTPYRAETGYVFARDAWGFGFATEVLGAVVSLAFGLPGLRRLSAACHAQHRASAHVLEKAGFRPEGLLRSHLLFPNLGADGPSDVLLYARVATGAGGTGTG